MKNYPRRRRPRHKMFRQLHLFQFADATLSHALFNNTFDALSRTAPYLDYKKRVRRWL